MRSRGNSLAHEAGADQAGKSDTEDGERKAGGDLIDGEAKRHQGKDQRQQGARDDPADGAYGRGAGEPGAAESARRSHDHHALDAEVEHAGAFGHEFAGGRDQ